MIERRSAEASPVGRRIRLSSREIAVSIVLTIAAIVAIVAVGYSNVALETGATRPVASDSPPRR
jgi:hypothetical protein